MPFTKQIQLSKLNLNKENPRFDPVVSQEMALKMFVEGEKGRSQLYNLAKSIAREGLNPSDLPIVYMDEDNNLTVKDGNRRITALLAITKPNKIPYPDEAYVKRFKTLKTSVEDIGKLRKVLCVIFEDEEEADKWVQLKHTGENEGIGTVQWDALMKLRFEKHRTGQASMELQAYEFLERHATAELRTKLKDIPITNLGRLLSNPEFRTALGFTLEDGILKYEIPKDEALKNLTKVAEDLTDNDPSKKIMVDDIKTAQKMHDYAKKLRSVGFLKPSEKLEQPIPVEEEKEQIESPLKEKKERKKELPFSKSRTKLIPPDCTMTIPDSRLNDIYLELKELSVNHYPNAVSVLFRVFLELSLDRYISAKGVRNAPPHTELKNKIKMVHDYFVDNGMMRKEEMQRMMILCNVAGNQPIPMTKQFNGYVHNPDFHPLSGDLKGLWDDLQPFILKLWE